ncbi:exodeoxyribonuclease VIII [Pseudomonas peli]|uniref:Exodeoxyribonuclease VIII n=1 Tax=Pseudomonas peli TaxID=592361 RepID=A0AB37Z3S1_9PSED|nr:3'-5' exonuclease [Pseudomonas peli]NMZ68840.1 3'-5' exoribonuclease [Pseudomonas peli]SCW39167.1 exodeoxyribonuclease VIII [Pseudomonas peli]
MINSTHYVLDLETMGKGPNSAIVAIGCVRIEQGTITGSLYRRVSLETSLLAGLQVDASTIEWWLQQDEAAREEIHKPGAIRLESALAQLAEFMGCNHLHKPNPKALLWGNGSSFDNVIVGNAFDACGIQRPWMFWNDRDLRTLLSLYPEAKALPFEGTKHHALDDAMHEAKQLLMALNIHQTLQVGALV